MFVTFGLGITTGLTKEWLQGIQWTERDIIHEDLFLDS